MTDTTKPNILFIMCDQLRWDYLSCNGHPTIKTPNIDALAAKGVNFTRSYVQSPVCGPSRASTYTGRYVSSHGATWNDMPLSISEKTIGDYLGVAGYRVAVCGKTHLSPDKDSIARLGLATSTPKGQKVATCGFEEFDRDDGIHLPIAFDQGHAPQYSAWLTSLGYEGYVPWHDYANSTETETGEVLSGWNMRAAQYPARIPVEHSETAYLTNRAMDFIEDSGNTPWLLHLSFIKPHWPYVAPAPFHNMYGKDDIMAPIRPAQRETASHPVQNAFQNMDVSHAFSDDTVREAVIPTYMGLISHIDTELGRLFDWLSETARAENTVIVFTSDHGDYLGDHWLGEKELFHDPSTRIPLIIMDPRRNADTMRGETVTDLVESIDLLPTFIDLAGLAADQQRLEGQSLMPFVEGRIPDTWREHAFSELDYAYYAARQELEIGPNDAWAYMICGARYKYVHYLGFPPQLFDLEADPNELTDLGRSPEHGDIRAKLERQLLEQLMRRRIRVTEADTVVDKRTAAAGKIGVEIGKWV